MGNYLAISTMRTGFVDVFVPMDWYANTKMIFYFRFTKFLPCRIKPFVGSGVIFSVKKLKP